MLYIAVVVVGVALFLEITDKRLQKVKSKGRLETESGQNYQRTKE